MKQFINNTALLFERIGKAGDAILTAKQLDGRHKDQNGTVRTVNRIRYEMRQLDEKLDKRREELIYQAEKLNADPNALPGDFLSAQQLLEQYGQCYRRFKHRGMWLREETRPGNYLTPSILNRLTWYWMRKNRIVQQPDATYYYNVIFIVSVLQAQRSKIVQGDLRNVNFMVKAWDRPLIYQYYPNKACINSTELNQLLTEWTRYNKIITAKLSRLSKEEDEADRGDFMISDESPMGSLYQEGDHVIFEIASKRFWKYVDFIYELSEKQPAYFKKGASRIIEGMYKYFCVTLYGKGRRISVHDFQIRATREFLFFSNEHKQLRVDLFRQINPSNEKANEVFTGGLFHIFDHFKGLRASEKNRGDLEYQEQRVLWILRDLFFNHSVLKKNETSGNQVYQADYKYPTPFYLNDKMEWVQREKNWRGVFYFNQAQNLFYLKTIYIC